MYNVIKDKIRILVRGILFMFGGSMLDFVVGLIVFCISLPITIIIFILANIDNLFKEGNMEKNIIEITPDKDGKLFITLYGTKYQIVIKQPKPVKKDK